MRSLVLLASMAVIAPGLAFAQTRPAGPNMTLGISTPTPALVCPGACLTWPRKVYDSASHEWVTFDINRMTGGYIKGVQQDTGKTWTADISVTGRMAGRDLDGSKWSYDPRTRLFHNHSTGRTCATTDVRHVCG